MLGKVDGHDKSAGLFRVYAEAFKGRRQLYWSNGLRKLLEVGCEVSDEEIAVAQEDSAMVLAQLSIEQWRAILATRTEAAVLSMAEDHADFLPTLLDSIVQMAAKKQVKNEGNGYDIDVADATARCRGLGEIPRETESRRRAFKDRDQRGSGSDCRWPDGSENRLG